MSVSVRFLLPFAAILIAKLFSVVPRLPVSVNWLIPFYKLRKVDPNDLYIEGEHILHSFFFSPIEVGAKSIQNDDDDDDGE